MRYLDGLRGVAALSVVAFHFMSAFLPGVVPDQSPTVPQWADSPLEVLCNGPFWVFVFFVLSGHVLGRASRKTRLHPWRDALARYLRLALPATASVVLAWALLSIFPKATTRLAELAPSPWFHWVMQSPIPSVLAALKDGLFGIFRNGYSFFNNVLWTMRIELMGSLAVYAFFQVVRRRRAAAWTVVLVALLLCRAPAGYLAFALGAGLSIAVRDGLHWPERVAVPMFLLGLLLGAPARGFAERHGLGGWPIDIRPGEMAGLLYPVGALLVVAGVLSSAALQRVFASRFCQWSGRLSFPLYLVHVPVLYTLVATTALYLTPFTGPRIAVLAVGFIVASVLLAELFDRVVDRPVLALNRLLTGPKASKA